MVSPDKIHERGTGGSMREYMTVKEMGDLLGIKKTDRYWLIKKGYFNVATIAGKMWVEVASFEKWYSGQVKYRKANGEKPGREVAEHSYSPREAADMLGVSDSLIYELVKAGHLNTIIVDGWMRIPKEDFYSWYGRQDRYRIKGPDPILSPPAPLQMGEKKEEGTDPGKLIHIRDAADLLGTGISGVYRAAEEYPALLGITEIRGTAYIREKDLDRFFRKQDRYCYHPENDRSVAKRGGECYLTIQQACSTARVTRPTIIAWHRQGKIPAIRAGRVVRIPLSGLERWLAEQQIVKRKEKEKWQRSENEEKYTM